MNQSNIGSDIAPRRLNPLAEVWTIAWPTVLTMTSYTVMQFADSLMVAQVGPMQVAAQGNGGIWAFSPIAFAFGIMTVVNTYVAQNLGAGKPENGPKYAWASVWLSLMIWLVLLLPWGLCLPALFSSMGHSPELQRLETGYGWILLGGSFILLAGKGLSHYFFGLHRPKVITVSAFLGNAVNIVVNYVLIFGEQGLPALGLPGVPGVPALGLYGAAIGTVVGTTVEVVIPAAIFLGPKMNAELKTRCAWRPRIAPMKDLLKIGWPAAVQFGNEIVCWSLFMSVLVGMFGEAHMTAGWATLRYMHLSFMPAVGFSVATTSLVGKYIGAGQPEVAVSRARLALLLSMIYMTVCGLFFFIFREGLIGFYVTGQNIDPDQAKHIIAIGAKLMMCAAVFQTIDAFGITYTGALRGAGDTIWPGMVTAIFSWVFIVGGGWMMVHFWPELESVGPWIAAAVYIAIFGVTMAWRFESGRWRSIQLLGSDDGEQPRISPVGPAPPASSPDATVRDIAEELAVEASRRCEQTKNVAVNDEPAGRCGS